MSYFRKAVGKDVQMDFQILKKALVTILTLVANCLSWRFNSVKIIELKGLPLMVNPTVNRSVLLNNYL